MKTIQSFLFGVFAAAIVGGVWWLILLAGFLALLVRQSYILLCVGVILDLWFAYNGIIGFYTVFFLLATILIEYFRQHLFWTS